MEPSESPVLPLQNFVVCENCRASQNAESKFCSTCSYPIQGTEDAKRIFFLDIRTRKRLLEETKENIGSARNTIYFAAFLFFVSGFIQYMMSDDFPTLIVNLVISLVFLILAAWSSSNAFGALVSAFVIYVTLQIVNLVIDPTTLFQGILVKIIMLAAFGKGVHSAITARDLTKELEKYKAKPLGEH